MIEYIEKHGYFPSIDMPECRAARSRVGGLGEEPDRNGAKLRLFSASPGFCFGLIFRNLAFRVRALVPFEPDRFAYVLEPVFLPIPYGFVQQSGPGQHQSGGNLVGDCNLMLVLRQQKRSGVDGAEW